MPAAVGDLQAHHALALDAGDDRQRARVVLVLAHGLDGVFQQLLDHAAQPTFGAHHPRQAQRRLPVDDDALGEQLVGHQADDFADQLVDVDRHAAADLAQRDRAAEAFQRIHAGLAGFAHGAEYRIAFGAVTQPPFEHAQRRADQG